MQANPVPDASNLSGNPSLAGICGGTFPSEAHRTAKYPVVGVDPSARRWSSPRRSRYDSAARRPRPR